MRTGEGDPRGGEGVGATRRPLLSVSHLLLLLRPCRWARVCRMFRLWALCQLLLAVGLARATLAPVVGRPKAADPGCRAWPWIEPWCPLYCVARLAADLGKRRECGNCRLIGVARYQTTVAQKPPAQLVGVLGRRPSIHTTSTRSLPVALPPLDRPDNVCRVWGELVEIPCREFAS